MTEPGFELGSLTRACAAHHCDASLEELYKREAIGMGQEGSKDTRQVMGTEEFAGPMEMKVLVGVRMIEGELERWKEVIREWALEI